MATAAGLPLIEATIHEPIDGIWVANVELDANEAPTPGEPATIDLDGDEWVGTIDRSALDSGRAKVRIIGGAAGLRTEIPARYYRSPTLQIVLDQILADAGETLSADAVDLSTISVERWTRTSGRAAEALDRLAAAAGHAWRVQRDGTVWLGTDDFDDSGADVLEADRDPRTKAVLLQPRGPLLVRPGTSVLGLPVYAVTTTWAPQGARQRVRYEASRTRAVLSAIVDAGAAKAIALRGLYRATVVTQRPNGNVDVLPDLDDLGRDTGGLSDVPIRYGFPGWAVEVTEGSRCLIGFEDGDEERPYVDQWLPGAIVVARFEGGTKDMARVDDHVSLGTVTAIDGDGLPVTFIHTRPAGGDPPLPPVMTSQVLDLTVGRITTGNPKLKA